MTKIARLATLAAVGALAATGFATAPVLAQGSSASAAEPARRAADPAMVRTLQDHVWTLQSGSEASGQPIEGLMLPGQPFVVRFDGARLAVGGGCNHMTGSWRLSPQGQLMVGRLAATMKACEPAAMKADATLSALLSQPLSVQLKGGATPALRLVSAAGQTLELEGEPTLASQYGAPTRIFLEVAAQTVPCQPGAGGPRQCLQVRERRFDAQGLRIEPPGEWRAFDEDIRGFTHQPGIRSVLRIDRYERKQVPADASRYVFVLDLVVESEIVKPT
jgi:heat shock protein HslJ